MAAGNEIWSRATPLSLSPPSAGAPMQYQVKVILVFFKASDRTEEDLGAMRDFVMQTNHLCNFVIQYKLYNIVGFLCNINLTSSSFFIYIQGMVTMLLSMVV